MIHPTDPKKLSNKEDPMEDSLISLRRGNRIFIRHRWREVTGWERK